MTRIREYNCATGHLETLAELPDDQAAAYLVLADDHSTDHVVYADHVEPAPWRVPGPGELDWAVAS